MEVKYTPTNISQEKETHLLNYPWMEYVSFRVLMFMGGLSCIVRSLANMTLTSSGWDTREISRNLRRNYDNMSTYYKLGPYKL